MKERTEYYISMENKMIETKNIPGQVELKIYATEEEVKKIQGYMENKEQRNEEVETSSKDNPSASYTPAIGDDEKYDSDFYKLIDLIYKLGTEKTKESLEQYR